MDLDSISDIPFVFEESKLDRKGGLDDLNNIEFSDELGQEIGDDILGLYSNDQDKPTTGIADWTTVGFDDVEETNSIEPEELSLCLCGECNEYFNSEKELNAHTCYELGNSKPITFEQAFQWNDLEDVGDSYECNFSIDYDDFGKYYDYNIPDNNVEEKEVVEKSIKDGSNQVEVDNCNTLIDINIDKCNNVIEKDVKPNNPFENFMADFIDDLLKEEAMTNQTEDNDRKTREPSKRIRNMREKKASQRKTANIENKSDNEKIKKKAGIKKKEGVKRKQKEEKKITKIDDRPPSDKRDRSDGGPHSCPQCDKSFCRRSSLAIHLRRHTGEMPFACDRCDKKFVVLYDLDRHMLIHLGRKKFTCFCEVCRKPFVSKAGLMQHKNTYHIPMALYPCDICGVNFATKSGLDDHKVTHEDEIVIEYYEPNAPDLVVVYDE